MQEQAATIVHAQQNIFGTHEKAVSGGGGGEGGVEGKTHTRTMTPGPNAWLAQYSVPLSKCSL